MFDDMVQLNLHDEFPLSLFSQWFNWNTDQVQHWPGRKSDSNLFTKKKLVHKSHGSQT